MMFSKFTSLYAKIKKETFVVIMKKKDAFIVDAKAKFLLRSRLIEWCNNLG
jgi:hypothetical protein